MEGSGHTINSLRGTSRRSGRFISGFFDIWDISVWNVLLRLCFALGDDLLLHLCSIQKSKRRKNQGINNPNGTCRTEDMLMRLCYAETFVFESYLRLLH
jgi:hypothetical protein